MSKFLLVLVALAVLGVGAAKVLQADPSPGKSRWEYRVEQLPAGTGDVNVARILGEKLTALTAEGWEYAGWVPVGSTYVMRRAR